MAITTGTVWSVHTIKADSESSLQVAEILFTMSGTYAQADDSKLANVHTLISASRRNGKTVTPLFAMPSTPATKVSDPAVIMGTKGMSVSTNDVVFTITDTDHATEHADATAIPAQSRPFAMLVAFTEA